MRSSIARKMNVGRGYLSGVDLGGLLNTVSQVATTAGTVAQAGGQVYATANQVTGGGKPNNSIQAQMLANQQAMQQQQLLQQQAQAAAADKSGSKDNTMLYVSIGAVVLGGMYLMSQKNNKKSK